MNSSWVAVVRYSSCGHIHRLGHGGITNRRNLIQAMVTARHIDTHYITLLVSLLPSNLRCLLVWNDGSESNI